MVRKLKRIILFLCMWTMALPMTASSFALRNMEKGDKVPDLEFTGLGGKEGDKGGRLSTFSGEKGLIIIYWATWSLRSTEILRFAQDSLRRYEAQGIRILAVNADHQEMTAADTAAVGAKAAELGIGFPVVLDAGLKGYSELGVISMPTLLLLSRDLTLIDAYPGFPSTARDDIPDRIDAFLGIVKEKREEKAQYLLDHAPKNHALMYYNFGKRLFLAARSSSGALKAVPESAVEKLDEAIRRDPDFFRPYLLKAVIFHMAKAAGPKEAAVKALSAREFQETYEQRALTFGYLYLGMDNAAADHLRLLESRDPGDAGVLFGEAVTAARRKNGAAAARALDALGKHPRAAEALGRDVRPLFTEKGELRPGTESDVAAVLERLLEIGNETQGTLRPDVPAGGGRGDAGPPGAPAAAGGKSGEERRP